MSRDDITRRAVLGGIGAGAITATVGSAAGRRRKRYIVGTDTGEAHRTAESMAETVHRRLNFGDVGAAVAGEFRAVAADQLAGRADVRYVEEEGYYHALAETTPWGVDRVDANVVHDDGQTGGDNDDGQGGADVAILDSGIDDDHPDLDGNVGEGRAFTDCSGSNCNYDWSDDNDHGTHCAGIADAEDNAEGVVGVSTGATLHAVKVLAGDGSGSISDIAAGLEWVADQGYDVASMSFGGPTGSATMQDACQYAHDNGVFLVGASGNSGPCSDCVSYPAAYSTVMAVSATDPDDSVANYSSTGPEVDIAAPGSQIESTVVGGYASYSGTSMACPHVAGAAAQLMDNGYTNTEARQRLANTAEDVGLAANDGGAGLLDVAAAVDSGDDSGGGDDAPTASWTSPTAGATVSGTTTVEIGASDAEDDAGTLTVEYRVDGGAWQATSYDAGAGTYAADWDTTAVDDGSHTLDARATDSAGNASGTASVAVTVNNTGSSGPTVEELTVTEAGSSDPHAEIDIDWAVADANGDLESVTLSVYDADSGSLLGQGNYDESGSNASGSATFTDYFAYGRTYEVVCEVTDAAGNSASAARTVSE